MLSKQDLKIGDIFRVVRDRVNPSYNGKLVTVIEIRKHDTYWDFVAEFLLDGETQHDDVFALSEVELVFKYD